MTFRPAFSAFAILVLSCTLVFCQTAAAPATATERVPVLVELFTSEGCSSCPPADRFLETLDSQPLASAEFIVLSEHVDYWDHDGWKDPYSSHDLTERQLNYTQQFRIPDAYTPQMIIDGSHQLSGSDGKGVEQAIREAVAHPKMTLRITKVSVDSSRVSVHVEGAALDGANGPKSLDLYIAIALNKAESQVLRGENANHHLTHVAVVRKLTRFSKIKAGEPLSRDIEVKLDSDADPHNLRVVVFLQDSSSGKVFGAAMKPVA
jgi:hypothetical protein